MSYVVGLTGGIGAGKSLVAQLAQENFPVLVLSTDEIARQQMLPGNISYIKVIEQFGTSILTKDKEIDRNKLAKIVFSDLNKVSILNAITHPNVKESVLLKIEQAKKDPNVKAVIVESALLFDAHFEEICDTVWYVLASENTRRYRLSQNRGYSNEKMNAIMKSQDKDHIALKKSNYVIFNDEGTSKEELIEQIRKLYNLL